jgi:hypothetical protein
MMTILEKSIPLHKAIWIDDIVSLGIDRVRIPCLFSPGAAFTRASEVWASGASLAQLPIFAFLQLIERVGGNPRRSANPEAKSWRGEARQRHGFARPLCDALSAFGVSHSNVTTAAF